MYCYYIRYIITFNILIIKVISYYRNCQFSGTRKLGYYLYYYHINVLIILLVIRVNKLHNNIIIFLISDLYR